MDKMSDKVEVLITKAADAAKPDDALKFSQAAYNVANAMQVLNEIEDPRPSGAGLASS